MKNISVQKSGLLLSDLFCKKDNSTKEAEAVLMATISKETAIKTRIENNNTISGIDELTSAVIEEKMKHDKEILLKLDISNDH